MLFLLVSMNSKKMLALVGKGVKETGMFGKMFPTLDSEVCDPQLMISSAKFQDIQYFIRVEFAALRLYVFKYDDRWRSVPSSSLDCIDYDGFRDEYKVIEGIVRNINESYGGGDM